MSWFSVCSLPVLSVQLFGRVFQQGGQWSMDEIEPRIVGHRTASVRDNRTDYNRWYQIGDQCFKLSSFDHRLPQLESIAEESQSVSHSPTEPIAWMIPSSSNNLDELLLKTMLALNRSYLIHLGQHNLLKTLKVNRPARQIIDQAGISSA